MKIYYLNFLFLPFIYFIYKKSGVQNNGQIIQEKSYNDANTKKSGRELSYNLFENYSHKQNMLNIYTIENSISPRVLTPQDLLDVFIANKNNSTDNSLYDYDNNGVVNSDDITRAYLLWKEDTHMLQQSMNCDSTTQISVSITPFSMRTGQNASMTSSMELRVTLHFSEPNALETVITGTHDNSNRINTHRGDNSFDLVFNTTHNIVDDIRLEFEYFMRDDTGFETLMSHNSKHRITSFNKSCQGFLQPLPPPAAPPAAPSPSTPPVFVCDLFTTLQAVTHRFSGKIYDASLSLENCTTYDVNLFEKPCSTRLSETRTKLLIIAGDRNGEQPPYWCDRFSINMPGERIKCLDLALEEGGSGDGFLDGGDALNFQTYINKLQNGVTDEFLSTTSPFTLDCGDRRMLSHISDYHDLHPATTGTVDCTGRGDSPRCYYTCPTGRAFSDCQHQFVNSSYAASEDAVFPNRGTINLSDRWFRLGLSFVYLDGRPFDLEVEVCETVSVTTTGITENTLCIYSEFIGQSSGNPKTCGSGNIITRKGPGYIRLSVAGTFEDECFSDHDVLQYHAPSGVVIDFKGFDALTGRPKTDFTHKDLGEVYLLEWRAPPPSPRSPGAPALLVGRVVRKL